jgi:hypothetical protein
VPIRCYTPATIGLDPARSVRREIPDESKLFEAPGGDPAGAADGFDHFTVFYDVVLSRRHDEIFAIGPPLLNLERALLPATYSLLDRDGGHLVDLEPSIEARSHYVVVRFAIPRKVRRSLAAQVRFVVRFVDGSVFEVVPNHVDETAVEISLSTLQKDEPLPWLRQWIQYWASLGVDRVVIYDNGSEYFDALPEALADLAERVTLVIVRWHFPYGPRHSFAYLFAQWGALNHARLVFRGARWGAAFDVDEYPALYRDERLDVLLRRQRPWVAQVRLQVCNVYNIGWEPGPDGHPPTALDFVYRDREAKRTYKYLYRTARTRVSGVHGADVGLMRSVVPAASDCVYFHYWGLNRGWKHQERLDAAELDPSKHVRDTWVADRLRSVMAGSIS